MKYSQIIALDTNVIGLGVENKFRANSLFDPDQSGIGHQPMGHDEWAVAYQHYRVVGSTIAINAAPVSGAVPDPAIFWVSLSSDASASVEATTVVERGRAAHKLINSGTDTPDKPLINSYVSEKFFGKAEATMQGQKALFGANPAEDVYFNVGVQQMIPSSPGRVYYALVTITYDCILTEPKPLATS